MRLMPSFKRATWQLMSSPTFFPLRRKYESSWGLMDGMDCLHALYNHQIFYQKVDPITEVEFFAS